MQNSQSDQIVFGGYEVKLKLSTSFGRVTCHAHVNSWHTHMRIYLQPETSGAFACSQIFPVTFFHEIWHSIRQSVYLNLCKFVYNNNLIALTNDKHSNTFAQSCSGLGNLYPWWVGTWVWACVCGIGMKWRLFRECRWVCEREQLGLGFLLDFASNALRNSRQIYVCGEVLNLICSAVTYHHISGAHIHVCA